MFCFIIGTIVTQRFKSPGSVVSHAHQCCIYLIKNTVKLYYYQISLQLKTILACHVSLSFKHVDGAQETVVIINVENS